MTTAFYYAQALYELVEVHPDKASVYVKNLRAALARRGHEKLLPRIWSEFQKLNLQKERTVKHRTTTPEMERTDKLLQLYRTLVTTK